MDADAKSRPAEAALAPASPASGSRRRKLLPWLAAGVTLFALAGATWFYWVGGRSDHSAVPVLGQTPHYQLINQNGEPVSSGDFAGKVQIVTALFPYCRELCPLVAANLAEFRDNVVRASDLEGRVVFVFFNVAPGDAGPADMRAFLKQYGWNPDDPAIQFLTGSPEEIRRVVQGGFHLFYERTKAGAEEEGARFLIENPLADRVKPDFDVAHADLVELVDGRGRVRQIFSSGTRIDDMRLRSAIVPLIAGSK